LTDPINHQGTASAVLFTSSVDEEDGVRCLFWNMQRRVTVNPVGKVTKPLKKELKNAQKY
jgi:hypothetical protein